MKTKKNSTKKTSSDRVLIMRTVAPSGKSYGGFRWPLEVGATVEAQDWNPEPMYGGGLHGFLLGEGDGGLASWSPNAKWIVVEADQADIVEIDNAQCKCRKCTIVHVGDRASATAYVQERCPGAVVVGGTATAGVGGTATAGYGGTATAGDGGTATAGEGGTATAGDGGTATAGEGGTATAGDCGTATAGDCGTATAGYGGTATAGDGGTATVGDRGTATAGYGGTATAGYGGTATAGDGGTATAGDGGTVIIRWYDGSAGRYRVIVGYVGEDGIEAGVAYRCEAAKLVRVTTGEVG